MWPFFPHPDGGGLYAWTHFCWGESHPTDRPGHIQLTSLLQEHNLLPNLATVTFVATGDWITGDWINAAQEKFQLKGSFKFYRSSTDPLGHTWY